MRENKKEGGRDCRRQALQLCGVEESDATKKLERVNSIACEENC